VRAAPGSVKPLLAVSSKGGCIMRSWFLKSGSGTKGAKQRPWVRPALESLEERCLLDGIPIIPNLPPTFVSASTVPANGDLNPYGVAFVPKGFPQGGPVHVGDVLVSNFNANSNLQGTGTTIVDISLTGQQSLFFQGSSAPGALGLTTALGVLQRGFVIVGSLPTLDGTSNTIQAPGSLLILDSHGNVVTTLSDSVLLDGPWDLTVHDQGEKAQVFVSNVLSGTVTRIDLKIPEHGNPTVQSETQIASGYLIRTDPAALVIGPTGLAYNAEDDILYVASTGDNAIFAISHAKSRTTDAGMGTVVYQDNVHLHGPLGLTLTPNGDLITSNGDAINPDPNQPSELVEFTPEGQFVAQLSVDPSAGAAFGMALQSSDDQIHFAAVDDALNTLDIWTINSADHPDRKHDRGNDRVQESESGLLAASVDAVLANSGMRTFASLSAAPNQGKSSVGESSASSATIQQNRSLPGGGQSDPSRGVKEAARHIDDVFADLFARGLFD
jgi:hypothetical protein